MIAKIGNFYVNFQHIEYVSQDASYILKTRYDVYFISGKVRSLMNDVGDEFGRLWDEYVDGINAMYEYIPKRDDMNDDVEAPGYQPSNVDIVPNGDGSVTVVTNEPSDETDA